MPSVPGAALGLGQPTPTVLLRLAGHPEGRTWALKTAMSTMDLRHRRAPLWPSLGPLHLMVWLACSQHILEAARCDTVDCHQLGVSESQGCLRLGTAVQPAQDPGGPWLSPATQVPGRPGCMQAACVTETPAWRPQSRCLDRLLGGCQQRQLAPLPGARLPHLSRPALMAWPRTAQESDPR